LGDPDEPFIIQLLDPATVYPVYSRKRGLLSVFHVYHDTIAGVAADYGDDDTDIRAKLKAAKPRLGDNTREGDREDHSVVEVIDYWDTYYRYVEADGVVLLNVTPHEYGYVPFAVTPGPFTETSALGPIDRAGDRTDGWYYDSDGQVAARPKYRSYIDSGKIRHEQHEAFMGRVVTGFKVSMNPPHYLQQGPLSADQGVPQVDLSEGSINPIRMDETPVAMPTAPNPAMMGQVMQAISTQRLTGSAPAAAYGDSPSGATGQTVQALTEAGTMARFIPWKQGLEQFYTDIATLVLKITRDWGYLLGPDDELGTFTVPRLKPRQGEEAYTKVTPEMIRAVGCRVNAELTDIRLSTLPMIAQSLTVLRRERLIDRLGAIELLGLSRDPQAVKDAVDREDIESLAPYQKWKLLQLLIESGQPEAARFVQAEIDKENAPQPEQPPQGAPPPSPMGPMMGPQGTPPGLGPVVQGMNNAGLGAPPGAMGAPVGRPPGPVMPNGY
jgi:hypothetical protein